MKRIFQFFIFYCACLSNLNAQNLTTDHSAVPHAEILPLAYKSLMLDVVSTNQETLVAVGSRGHILLSNDGETWVQKPVATNSNLTKVYFYNEQLGWAIGHDSVIVHTKDGGETWLLQNYQPEKERPFFDILFFSETHGIAVGAYGTLYRTRNGGDTWQEEFHLELLNEDDQLYLSELELEDPEFYKEEIASILPHFNRLLFIGDTLYLAGEIGLVAKSSDNGKTFKTASEFYLGSFFDISELNDGTLLVVGLRGNIFTSSDAGENWQRIPSHTTALLNDIVLNNDGTVTILANSGVVLHSPDGKTFSMTTEKDGKAIIAGTWFNNKLVVATEVGVKILDTK